MSLVRELTETVLDTLVPGVVDGINSISDFLFQNVITTFSAYKSQAPIDPGWGSVFGLLGLIIGGTFLFIGVFAFVTLVRRTLILFNRQDAFTRPQKWAAGFGLYAIFQLALAGHMNPISVAKRTKTDSAVVGAIFGNQLPNYTVDMTGFTWGLLGNTLLEFIIQVGLLTFAISLVAWWYTDFVSLPNEMEFVIDFIPMLAPVVLWIYATVQGIQVFPLDGRTAFILQISSLVGLMIILAAGLVWFGYMLAVWPPLDLTVNRPRKLWLTFDGVMLATLVAIAASGFTGLLLWVFAKIAILRYRHGIDVPGGAAPAEEIPGGN